MRSLLFLLGLFLAATASAGINSFTASPTIFLPGQDVTLSWNVTAGDVISISPGVGSVSGATGSVTVQPTANTTYTLTNSTSSTSAQVTVTLFTSAALVHRWSFNEASGNAVNDSVGTSHGTLINATSGANWSRTNASGGATSPDRVRLPGGGSGNAPYIDLANSAMTGLTKVTFEGWITLHGAQNWSRIFDFGTTTAGELNAPGGSFSGQEYMLLSAQVGGTTTSRRISMKDNGTENFADVTTDSVTYGTEFHFAAVYDPVGNNGSPNFSYFKNGVLMGTLNTAFRPQDISFVNNWLGRSNWSGDNNTNGSYNEFRIWSGPLPASAIADNIVAGPNAIPQVPRIDSFAIFPTTTIYSGTSVRLSYVVADPSGTGVSLSINQGIGNVSGSSGFVTVTPMQTTTYTLTATNSSGTRTANATVTVIPSQPVAEHLAITAGYQTATPVTLIANDPNTPAGSLTYSIVAQPAHGTLSGTGTNRTYTPHSSYSGPDSFTYKANDGSSDSNVATVTITVGAPPGAPTDITLSEDALFTNYVSGSFTGLLQAVDVNADDRFTFTLVSGTGSTHNSLFTISGNQLIANHNFAGDLGQTISIRLRVTDLAGNFVEKVLTFPVQAPSLHVKINEINYNPSRNTQLSEFIELYNPFNTEVNIGGWRFTAGVDYTFPANTMIPAQGYIVVAQDPATINALYGITALGPWTGGLSSDGEEIELRNASGVRVDTVDYGITAPWPVPPNGDGPSLELIHPDLDNDRGGNWRASSVTPGAFSYLTMSSTGWRYRKGTNEASSPIGAWRAEGFAEDGTWITGTAPIGLFKRNNNTSLATLGETGVTLGTQLTDMATFVSSSGGSQSNFSTAYRSVFFRKTFSVAGSVPRSVLLRVMHNDAAIVWINGMEVGRFGFPPEMTGDPPFDTTLIYERGNDPWSEVVLLNAPALLHPGTNTIAVQGFAKVPATRPTGAGGLSQEDLANYNVFDFCIDAEVKSSPDMLGTPGAINSVFATNSAPAVRDVHHAPSAPKSWEPIVVIAKVSDPQGVGSVQLSYQVCAPGNYIPSTLPLTAAQILSNPNQVLPANPAFENVANWTTIAMVDDGSVSGDVPGDGIFSARIPAQPHRTLVRYRVTATDLPGASARFPGTDDPRRNYAFYVYNSVPAYSAGGQLFAPATLNTLPVYHWIMRPQDFTALMAYNGSEQIQHTIDLNNILARHYEAWQGTLVFGDQVLDHTRIRLRGGNSRYQGSGKRHFRFKFPKGTALDATDEAGRPYPREWEEMLFNKMFGNKGYYDWGLVYEVGGKLWSQQGVPMPHSHWVHFRVVRNANETDASLGDFWGLYQALELPEGKNFLDARDLPPGNFYKMTDWQQNGEMDERYQAAGAPDFGEDFDNIRYNIHQTASKSFIETYVHTPLWYRYNALQEAIRHYDIFVDPTGRHRVKNLIWYFEPQPGNWLGRCWFMPYDWDSSFGPTFNDGWDFMYNAIYDKIDIADSPTWQLPKPDRTAMRIEHRNAIREVRDLIWYRDQGTGRGPLDDMIDDALATIGAFWPADRARWPVTGAIADHPSGAPFKAQDMKNFAFTGWTDQVASDPAVGAGGRAAHLDNISDAIDAGLVPNTPTLTYTGAAGYPVDGIALQSSAFSDPQGSANFAAMQVRVGEITDPTAPEYDPTAERIYEAVPIWESGELTTFSANVMVPSNVLRVGHTYRARVRHKDITGRWSHWSAPVQFTASTSNYVAVLQQNLMVSEIMYQPAPPSGAAEAGYLQSDFEYVELLNISSGLTLNLATVRITKGADFDFAGSAITTLAPGARVLVVKNLGAFQARYGMGKPVAGVWDATQNLSNGGEEFKVSFGAGAAIQEFEYDNNSPWPPEGDDGGYSIILKAPETRPNHNVGTNWRASYNLHGSPGTDTQSYGAWDAANASAGPLADTDFDGVLDILEYFLGGTNATNDRSRMPAGAIQELVVGGVPGKYLTITFRRSLRAEDVTHAAQFSPDMNDWSVPGVLVSSTDHGDGTLTEVWRAPVTTSAGQHFARVRVIRP